MKGDFKIMVKINNEEDWEEFSGIFYKQEFDSIVGHVKRHFNSEQFKKYQFGVFRKEKDHDYKYKEQAVWGLKEVIKF